MDIDHGSQTLWNTGHYGKCYKHSSSANNRSLSFKFSVKRNWCWKIVSKLVTCYVEKTKQNVVCEISYWRLGNQLAVWKFAPVVEDDKMMMMVINGGDGDNIGDDRGCWWVFWEIIVIVVRVVNDGNFCFTTEKNCMYESWCEKKTKQKCQPSLCLTL